MTKVTNPVITLHLFAVSVALLPVPCSLAGPSPSVTAIEVGCGVTHAAPVLDYVVYVKAGVGSQVTDKSGNTVKSLPADYAWNGFTKNVIYFHDQHRNRYFLNSDLDIVPMLGIEPISDGSEIIFKTDSDKAWVFSHSADQTDIRRLGLSEYGEEKDKETLWPAILSDGRLTRLKMPQGIHLSSTASVASPDSMRAYNFVPISADLILGSITAQPTQGASVIGVPVVWRGGEPTILPPLAGDLRWPAGAAGFPASYAPSGINSAGDVVGTVTLQNHDLEAQNYLHTFLVVWQNNTARVLPYPQQVVELAATIRELGPHDSDITDPEAWGFGKPMGARPTRISIDEEGNVGALVTAGHKQLAYIWTGSQVIDVMSELKLQENLMGFSLFPNGRTAYLETSDGSGGRIVRVVQF